MSLRGAGSISTVSASPASSTRHAGGYSMSQCQTWAQALPARRPPRPLSGGQAQRCEGLVLPVTLEGKASMFALGDYAAVSLAEARDRCEAARQLVKQGINLAQQRQIDRIQQASDVEITFEKVACGWLQTNAGKTSPRTGARICWSAWRLARSARCPSVQSHLPVCGASCSVNSTRKLIQFSARQHFKTDTAPSFFHAGRGQLRHRPSALAGKVVAAHQSCLALPFQSVALARDRYHTGMVQ